MKRSYTSQLSRCVAISAALAIACAGLAAPTFDPVADAIAKARHQPPREALKILQRVESLAPHRADLLARIAIAWSDCVDAAQESQDKSGAERAAKHSHEMAQKALKAGPDNAKAHLAMALGAGRMTDYVSSGQMVVLSRMVKDEAERAIALDPKEEGAYYVLGRWHFGVASVNPLLKFAARMVVGSLPPASMKEAIRNLEKAVALAPDDIDYHLQLALVYKATGKKDKAAVQWRAILKLPSHERHDEQAKAEAKAALGKE